MCVISRLGELTSRSVEMIDFQSDTWLSVSFEHSSSARGCSDVEDAADTGDGVVLEEARRSCSSMN